MAAVAASPPPGDSDPEQESNQKRTERCFASDIVQDAKRHPGSASGIDSIADPLRGPFQGVGDFADRRFLPNGWIDPFREEGGRRGIIGYDLYSWTS
jgi:hypothetical protein